MGRFDIHSDIQLAVYIHPENSSVGDYGLRLKCDQLDTHPGARSVADMHSKGWFVGDYCLRLKADRFDTHFGVSRLLI